KNNKILGICVGMQILASTSDEGELSGFSFINNNFDKLKSKLIPHIGWNNVSIKKNHYLFENIEDNSLFYFLHSYCLSEFQKQYIVAETSYEQNFISVFEKENITGVQFHPEKSHTQGQKLLINFYKS
ncbi:imidazole glycerol phosphate synthase subunit HisH, partial [Candidatus Pelagibacter sp.]|nr:imidazole glycerol phosphate synthase subunit HisH [Candidatus Pelagibacter sp.]